MHEVAPCVVCREPILEHCFRPPVASIRLPPHLLYIPSSSLPFRRTVLDPPTRLRCVAQCIFLAILRVCAIGEMKDVRGEACAGCA